MLITSDSFPVANSDFVVPNGRELVIFRVRGNHSPGTDITVASVDASNPNDEQIIAFISDQSDDLPDGTVLVQEGRKLRIYTQVGEAPFNVLGYVRHKTDHHPRAPSSYFECLNLPPISLSNISSSLVVPMGKELVILRCDLSWFWGGDIFLSSQSNSNASDIVDLYALPQGSDSSTIFPEGSVVISEGRRVHIHINNIGNFQGFELPGDVGVFGFLRDK